MPKESNVAFPLAVRGYYRKQGDTSQAVGMGCATIGRAADAAELLQFQKTLDFAFESGIRYFDTSAKYGGSEFRLGEFLRRMPREDVFVATKSPFPAELSPAEVGQFLRQAIHTSCERLGVSHIDLFQVHDVFSLDAVFAPGGGLEALKLAQEEGTIGYIGLGVRYHDLLARAAFSGEFDTILTYLDYTPLNTSAARLITAASTRGVGVINGSPLAFGLLTGDDPRKKQFHDSEFRRWLADASRLYDLCTAQSWSLLGAAMQFPMRNPHIHMTLTGPAFPEELRTTLQAIDIPLPDTAWEIIAKEIGHCLPQNLAQGEMG